ncbi:MAG: hypothetical protein U0Q22_17845 [Acidimicrobiales bacterium]
MRLVRFEDESGGFAVDLHPLITVISGLPAHVRERLVSGLASLPRGSDPGGRGALEVHGVYLDLNRESLELLELNHDLDVVLRPGDLPGAEAAEAAADAEPDLDLDDGTDDDEVRDARRAVEQVDESFVTAEHTVEVFRSQLAEIEREQAALHHRLAEARSGLDSFAAAGLTVAVEELEAAEAAAREQAATPPAPQPVATAEPASAGPDDAERARIEARERVTEESDRLRRLIKTLRASSTPRRCSRRSTRLRPGRPRAAPDSLVDGASVIHPEPEPEPEPQPQIEDEVLPEPGAGPEPEFETSPEARALIGTGRHLRVGRPPSPSARTVPTSSPWRGTRRETPCSPRSAT